MDHPQTTGAVAAFRSIKAAKNFFMWLIAMALVLQLGGFIAVHCFGVLDPLYVKEAAPATQPAATQPAATQPALASADNSDDLLAEISREVLVYGLEATKFFSFVLCLLAVLTLMFAVKLSLVGALGGMGGFMSAFFWSLILLATLTPWENIVGGGFVFGAMHSFCAMKNAIMSMRPQWGAGSVEMFDMIVFYGRFVAYPSVALLIWLIVMLKFAKGYKTSALAPVGTILAERPTEPGN